MPLETRLPGARRALLLLLAINLFNYLDRYILAAVEPEIRKALFAVNDPNAMAKTGMLAFVFLMSYMLLAPLFGWLADRYSRWMLAGIGVAVWSLASGASGLAGSFMILLLTRVFVGVGEAGYGPAAPTLIADYFPVSVRGRVLSYFYMAIPAGSALGFVFGGAVCKYWGWRWPFYLVTIPGLLLAGLCYFMREPRTLLMRTKAVSSGCAEEEAKPTAMPFWEGLRGLLRNRSYVCNTAAMTAMTFAIGGLSFWVPSYIHEFRGLKDLGAVNIIFGVITVLAGLFSTLLGGLIADHMECSQPGRKFPGSGYGILIAFPLTLFVLSTPYMEHFGVPSILPDRVWGAMAGVAALVSTVIGCLVVCVKRGHPGGYFLVSGTGMLIAFPLTVIMLFTPFPWFWVMLFYVEFFLFFNTGPANAALVNVTAPSIRATAFAVNIFVIHALGDAISPPLIGAIADRWKMNAAFLAVSGTIAIAGLFWLWGAKYLEADSNAVANLTES